MVALVLLPQQRLQRGEGVFHGADESEIDRRATAEVAAADVDLNDFGVVGIERLIGKVGAQHQQRIRLFDRLIPGGEAQKTGHADVERVVVFDELLATQRVHDRCSQRRGGMDHLVM